MHTFAMNYAPLMASFLAKEAGTFRDNPIVLLDVGARGGVGREWDVFGDQLRAYAFEPNEEECQRLAAAAPPNLTYIPRALGRQRGRQTLYETAHPDAAGLYRTDEKYLGRFLNRDNGVIVGESTVEVSALDDVLAEFNVPAVDFIKLDVEGAELDVLKGGPGCIDNPSLLGLLSEIRFHREINGSPSFSELDLFLRTCGFMLFDLQFHYQSRIALPYPGLQHYRRANGEPFFAYTTRGQIQDGNALYLRDLLLPDRKPLIGEVSATSVLKMCAVMEIFSLNDCAAELLLATRTRIDALTDTTYLLDLLASGICGTTTSFKDYAERFARHPAPVAADLDPPRQRHRRKPASLLERLARSISAAR
jgi:FkbM family methyltransferase